jgi:nicotinamide mononucleotide adenylyltransferase
MGFKLEYNNLIIEQSNKKPIVGYVGRFQPFHKNHYDTYKFLVKKYGKDNVYILTSDKTDKKKSPFNFKDKLKFMNMFNIPKDKIVQTKMPYIPKELFESKNIPDDTPFIAAVGQKDQDRLKHFVDYEGPVKDQKVLTGWSKDVHERAKIHAYYEVTPLMTTKFDGEIISGTTVRDIFKSDDENKQKKLFKVLYNKYDKDLFNFIRNKINGI